MLFSSWSGRCFLVVIALSLPQPIQADDRARPADRSGPAAKPEAKEAGSGQTEKRQANRAIVPRDRQQLDHETAPRPDAIPAVLAAELGHLRAAVQELHARQERLERQLQEVSERLQHNGPLGHEAGAAVRREPGDPGARELAVAARRLDHLRAAIENLRSAGLEDPARRLEEQAAALDRDLAQARENQARGRREAQAPRPAEAELAELRRVVERLRAENNELRKTLEHRAGAADRR